MAIPTTLMPHPSVHEPNAGPGWFLTQKCRFMLATANAQPLTILPSIPSLMAAAKIGVLGNPLNALMRSATTPVFCAH